jgi:hypothetical protein
MARIPLPETILQLSAAQIYAIFPNAQLVLQIPVPEAPNPKVIPQELATSGPAHLRLRTNLWWVIWSFLGITNFAIPRIHPKDHF